MTREEELNQAIDNMTNVIEAARYLFVEINADNTEAILREQARLEKFEAKRAQYVAELKELTSQTQLSGLTGVYRPEIEPLYFC